MTRATRYAKRLRRAPAIGILLNDGRVVSIPRADLKRLQPKPEHVLAEPEQPAMQRFLRRLLSAGRV